MTYRFVPRRLRMAAQLATLAVTAVVGLSIVVTPQKYDPKLSVIEQAMTADAWGLVLVAFGTVGFFLELYSSVRSRQPLFWLVSACHIMCCSVLLAYSIAALVGVFSHAPWNFGAPALGVLVAFWHYIYVQRRPREPVTYVE
jgi:FtsH-binding integral membrane protein